MQRNTNCKDSRTLLKILNNSYSIEGLYYYLSLTSYVKDTKGHRVYKRTPSIQKDTEYTKV